RQRAGGATHRARGRAACCRVRRRRRRGIARAGRSAAPGAVRRHASYSGDAYPARSRALRSRRNRSGGSAMTAPFASISDLLAALHALPDTKVLVVGDAMMDRYVYGEVDRISPEAPVPVLRAGRETAVLGGAGNVVRNLAALGASVRFVAAVGDDSAGEELQRLLAAEPCVAADLAVEHGRITTLKIRYVAGGHQLLRADRETSAPPAPAAAERLAQAAVAGVAACDVVMLSDYGKGVLTPVLLRTILDAAQAAGRPVVVDPTGGDFHRYRGATLVTPNRRELGEASNMPVEGDEAI